MARGAVLNFCSKAAAGFVCVDFRRNNHIVHVRLDYEVYVTEYGYHIEFTNIDTRDPALLVKLKDPEMKNKILGFVINQIREAKGGEIVLRKNEKRILRGLMTNPKGSDRGVASGAGVSQPTVTRARNRFEEEGVIKSYEVIPNLEKLGYEIIAFSTVDPRAFAEKDTRAVFAVQVEDMSGMKKKRTGNVLVMSVHRNFTDYDNFVRKHMAEPVFLTIASATVKPISFKDIPF